MTFSAVLNSIFSTALMLFLVLDPAGNLPLFAGILKRESAAGYRRTVLRESLCALAVLLLFLLFGCRILKLLQVSETSLGIAGGVILFLIALKMVFGAPIVHTDPGVPARTPLIVPLAVPLFAGPSAIAMTILIQGRASFFINCAALLAAWTAATLILLSGRWLARRFGARVLDAVESLMGFLLAVMAVEQLINGIRTVIGG